MDEHQKNITSLAEEGVSYLDKEEYEKAAEKFKALLDIDPSYPYVRVNLGICYMNLKKYDMAEREFKKALEKIPNPFSAHYHLSLTYYF
ncbi:MAG: tetratricopeptide repeat protein, partial [Candidatus Eremiobacterota bacterium]